MKVCLYVLIFAGILTALLFGIDREIARQDYNEKSHVSGCIFSINCQHFEKMGG